MGDFYTFFTSNITTFAYICSHVREVGRRKLILPFFYFLFFFLHFQPRAIEKYILMPGLMGNLAIFGCLKGPLFSWEENQKKFLELLANWI